MTAIPLYQHIENLQVNDVPPMKSISQAELDRQCMIANEMDKKDIELQQLMDDALENIDGWTA